MFDEKFSFRKKNYESLLFFGDFLSFQENNFANSKVNSSIKFDFLPIFVLCLVSKTKKKFWKLCFTFNIPLKNIIKQVPPAFFWGALKNYMHLF